MMAFKRKNFSLIPFSLFMNDVKFAFHTIRMKRTQFKLNQAEK